MHAQAMRLWRHACQPTTSVLLIVLAGATLQMLLIVNTHSLTLPAMGRMVTVAAGSFLLLVAAQAYRWLRWLAAATFLLISCGMLAVLLYYQYFFSMPSLTTLRLITQAPAVRGAIFTLLQPWHAGMLAAILLAALCYLRSSNRRLSPRRWVQCALAGLLLVMAPLMIAVKASRTLGLGPGNIAMDRLAYSFHFDQSAGFSRYGFIAYLWQNYRDYRRSGMVARPLPNPNPPLDPRAPAPPLGHAPSIILIQLESFDRNLIGREVDGQPVTPFMNRLAAEGWYWDNFFAVHEKGGSSDAELASLTGLLPDPTSPTFNLRNLSDLPSIARMLRLAGYQTAGFHGNVASFWRRGGAYRELGFHTFTGGDDYTPPASGFHSDDDAFFQQTIPKLQRLADKGPFFAYLITNTMHTPFTTIPPDRLDNAITARDPLVTAYFRHARYTDKALSNFHDEMRKLAFADSCVWVLYGDHASRIATADYSSEHTRGERVPLIIWKPGTKGQRVPLVGSHQDIAPTLAHLAGLPPHPAWYTRSLFQWTADRLMPMSQAHDGLVLSPYGSTPVQSAIDARLIRAGIYSQSYYHHFDAAPPPPEEPLRQVAYVAHAMGSIDGVRYTNSLEAFLRSYQLGFRYFEVDFAITADEQLLCQHDGVEQWLGFDRPFSQLQLNEIKRRRIQNRYQLLDVHDLLKLMQQYPDIHIVTDFKDELRRSLLLLARAAQLYDSQLLDRFVIQIYSADDAKMLDSLDTHFPRALFTLYRTGATDDQVLDVVTSHEKVRGVVMSEQRFSTEFAARLAAMQIPSFVHTINDHDLINRYLAAGCQGVFTDALHVDFTRPAP